ncbi:MAG: hypothetical protein JSW47_04730, partial [Phycisphaerales bacterium]
HWSYLYQISRSLVKEDPHTRGRFSCLAGILLNFFATIKGPVPKSLNTGPFRSQVLSLSI